MLRITELHRRQKLVVSFELFPPKTPELETQLFEQSVPELMKLGPAFMTCTYGAGGSTHEQTLGIVGKLRRGFGLEAASHLTCVGASRQEISEYLDRAAELGVSNIVALRGDAPKGDTSFRPHPEGFKLARELVEYIRSRSQFDIAVAGYPEGHPECSDKRLDWQRLAEKVESGADAIITQLFYDTHDYFEMREYLRNRMGVKVPIVAGVLPIMSKQQIERFCGMCGAKLPPEVHRELERYAEDHAACRQYGVELATRMCRELIEAGVDGIHFYTLNRVRSTAEVLANLGLLPAGGAVAGPASA